MTREEAIEVIKAYRDNLTNSASNQLDGDIEAFDMAIKALEQEPCDDAISRQAVDDYIVKLLSGYLYDEERTRLEELSAYLWELPSVNPQEPKWDRLYSWLNDMRYGIAPDETVTDIDERNVRTAQVDLLDEIMEWIEKHPQEPKTGFIPKSVIEDIKAEIKEEADGSMGSIGDGYYDALDIIDKHIGGAKMEVSK